MFSLFTLLIVFLITLIQLFLLEIIKKKPLYFGRNIIYYIAAETCGEFWPLIKKKMLRSDTCTILERNELKLPVFSQIIQKKI